MKEETKKKIKKVYYNVLCSAKGCKNKVGYYYISKLWGKKYHYFNEAWQDGRMVKDGRFATYCSRKCLKSKKLKP